MNIKVVTALTAVISGSWDRMLYILHFKPRNHHKVIAQGYSLYKIALYHNKLVNTITISFSSSSLRLISLKRTVT